MFNESFPSDPEIKPELIEASERLESLNVKRIIETSVDQDGTATITLENGKKLSFSITDENHISVNNLKID